MRYVQLGRRLRRATSIPRKVCRFTSPILVSALSVPGLLLGCSSEFAGSADSTPLSFASGGHDAYIGGNGGTGNPTTVGGFFSASGGAFAQAPGGGASEIECDDGVFTPGPAPLRRLSRFEYNNTLEVLIDDQSRLGNSLPPELLGNGYGNDAAHQPVSSFLAEQYSIVAEKAGLASVANEVVMARYAPCYSVVAPETERACTRTFIENIGKAAYRRPLEVDEVQELLDLQIVIRDTVDYQSSLASVVEAILQTPDFLYRLEFGDVDKTDPQRLRLRAHEMAARLSFFLWGGPPDGELARAAAAGELQTDSGVLSQARRMLDDPRARMVFRYFFDHFLPIDNLSDLTRDGVQFPEFSPKIGSLMREETHSFLEHEIFEGPGDWPSALTAPYTFVNRELAEFYGFSGVSGDEFEKVAVDTTKRLGLLTQGSILTGSTVSNYTNPVRRGVFLLKNIMCVHLPEPPAALAAEITPPPPSSGATGRERYSAHSQMPICAGCHAVMDPPGFALENYDAVGQWRDDENGSVIDASGELSILPEPFNGPIELVQLLAESEETQACFAHNWTTFAYGRAIEEEDACLEHTVAEQFAQSGYNIKSLLLSLTQTDAFLYLPPLEDR